MTLRNLIIFDTFLSIKEDTVYKIWGGFVELWGQMGGAASWLDWRGIGGEMQNRVDYRDRAFLVLFGVI